MEPKTAKQGIRDVFRHHHPLTLDETKALWNTCIFALDTNVLLNVYRYAAPTREDLFRVLRHLGDRVWVPHQVAKEFYTNRLDVIREQEKKYDELSREVSGALSAINDGAYRKSGFLNVPELEGLLRPAVEKAVAVIAKQKADHPNLVRDDSYLTTLVEIVGLSIGNEPTPDQLKGEPDDAQARINAKRPPGYRDSQKPAPQRYGDVFIWFELLRLANTLKKPIVFVTDDDKEDWWQVVEGEKLGPRPELREEMWRIAGADFGICNPAKLMERIGEQLTVSVPATSIDDARKIAEELQERNAAAHLRPPEGQAWGGKSWVNAPDSHFSLRRAAEHAVAEWLARTHSSSSVHMRTPKGDLLLVEPNSRTTVDVLTVRDRAHARSVSSRIRDAGYRAYYEARNGADERRLLVVVAMDIELAFVMADALERLSPPLPAVSIGSIPSGQYEELVQVPQSTMGWSHDEVADKGNS